MKEKVKVKHGLVFKIVPIISLLMVLASIVTFAIGMFGGKTIDKTERERQEFLSKPYIEETIEAIYTIDFSSIKYTEIESVTHLVQTGYFSVVYVNNANTFTKYFDLKTKREISENMAG